MPKVRTALSLAPLALLLALLPLATAGFDQASADEEAATYGTDLLGRVELPNSGAEQAQKAFLSGLAALHSFWYDEAADLFREAQTIDPDFALAYWGEALTYNHPLWSQYDGEGGRAALAHLAATPAERAAKAGTEMERDYLETAEVLFDDSHQDKAARDRAYSAAWQRVYEKHPQDTEAKAFYALSLQGLPRTGDARQHMRSAALMEELFALNPLHPGAAHYLIHAYDDPVHAPLGLRAARVYAEIAPAANHALHMPSHIFVQLGMWERVATSNLAAYNASVDWVERRGHPLYKRDFHSLPWLHYAYLQQGRLDKASECIDIIRPVALKTDDQRTRSAYRGMLARQAVETGSPLLEVAEKDGNAASDTLTAFGVGYAAALNGDAHTAEEALAELKALGTNRVHHTDSRILVDLLAAVTASANGDNEAALAAARAAIEVELTHLPPSGPPGNFKPAHELYGELLLAAGRNEEAAEQFHRSLLRTPKRTASLLGAARAAKALGQDKAAREFYAQLSNNLSQADAANPTLAEARSYLSQD